jgi:hypothetical protein
MASGNGLVRDSAQFKSEVCKMAEDLAEAGLNGSLERVMIITLNSTGDPRVQLLGCRPSDGLGMLMLAQGLLMRQLFA